jgi:hypothetical protein
MKAFIKIFLLCILIFGLGLYITKKSIDNTFEKVHCSQVDNTSPSKIILKIKEV